MTNVVHLSQEQYRICPRCSRNLAFSMYSKSKNKKFGLQAICKECKFEEGKKYYAKRAEYSMKYRHSLPIKEYLLANIKRSALKRKIECTVTLEDLPIIPEACPVLGTKLNVRVKSNRNLYSVDRIDNNKGYVPGNIVIVSKKINTTKSDLTFEELERMYFFYKQFQDNATISPE